MATVSKSKISEKPLKPVEIARPLNPGYYHDGDGLYLKASKAGTKSWVLRYMFAGTARNMGLGGFPKVGLSEARDRRKHADRMIWEGRDPIAVRDATKAEQRAKREAAKVEKAKARTFKQCAEKYIAAHADAWRNDKHRAQWNSTLQTYVYPVIGHLPVAAIDTALVLKVLEPIWKEKPDTAGRVRGRIELILSWATVREYRKGDNPARWRGHLDHVLPPQSKVRAVKHHEAMPYVELPGFMADLRANDSLSARALEFTILTAVRTGESINAQWSEFDADLTTWSIPGARMKSGKEHRVPLSARAKEILKHLPRVSGGYVFPGRKIGKPLSNMAMLELVRGMRGNGLTVHGFRSTFRDWAADQTAFPNHIAEMALAHTLKDKTEAAYRRTDLFEKRTALMKAWAGYCASAVAKREYGKVTPIRA